MSDKVNVIGGNVPSLVVGGRLFTDLDNLMVLFGFVSTNDYCTLRKSGIASGYQAPVGKKFQCLAAKTITQDNNAASQALTVGYADNDVGLNTATVPTNRIGPYGVTPDQYHGVLTTGLDEVKTETSIFFEILAQKYPFIFTNGMARIEAQIFGYEVDA